MVTLPPRGPAATENTTGDLHTVVCGNVAVVVSI